MGGTYGMFVAMVVVTVASPGPGVLMTLDNAIARGWRAAMHGVLGLALGAAVMAGVSSAGIGLLSRLAPPLFVLLTYAGAAYLFYLSFKTWRRTPQASIASCGSNGLHVAREDDIGAARKRLVAGALLQVCNPKSLFFFLSVLPQAAANAAGQPVWHALAIATYCAVLILVHGLYAGLAARARTWLSQPGTARVLSRLSAVMFLAFGVAMLMRSAP
ncbi:LysE family translocator [Pseudoduganella albidiflava]|uniref:LysE family translocator n=1 Tax=Pseudoduganella albidiflava TaxID=321983 RepID=A0A411X4H0_9BURK|nr:LysE family translocator [Pseudoduganella albidiflava]QBI03783.1 LysE family translocator [Pseudoduganella albidiflava]GGY61641.1 lysine transporter LysE [Pseudoduganella albidiflava]